MFKRMSTRDKVVGAVAVVAGVTGAGMIVDSHRHPAPQAPVRERFKDDDKQIGRKYETAPNKADRELAQNELPVRGKR